MNPPPVLVVMGVSGSGKSTVGAALAQRLDVEFVEGDDFHPQRNVELMAAGIALTDADRAPWLEALSAHMVRAARSGVVVSCSALRRAYRDVLRGTGRAGAPAVRFVWLDLPREALEARLASRTGHYMPPSLLDSQLETLEPPQPDEAAIRIDASQPVADIVAEAIARLDLAITPTATP